MAKLFCGCDLETGKLCWEARTLRNRYHRTLEIAKMSGDAREATLLRDELQEHFGSTTVVGGDNE